MEMLDAPDQVHVSGPHCCRLAGPSFQPMENITFQMESQVAEQEEEFQKPKYIFNGFMERLWAYLTIHQLLERMWVACIPKGLMGQPHTASWVGELRWPGHLLCVESGGSGCGV